MHCFDQLEYAFENGKLEDLDLHGGILSIFSPGGSTYILSKHSPSRQLWLASPVSGGLHFNFDEDAQCWHLPDGRLLYDIMLAELAAEGVALVL